MASEISIFAADLIAVLFALVQVAFWVLILGVVVTVAFRGAKVLNNWFTLQDYRNAYQKGLWEKRSEKTGVPLVWEHSEASWADKLETDLADKKKK